MSYYNRAEAASASLPSPVFRVDKSTDFANKGPLPNGDIATSQARVEVSLLDMPDSLLSNPTLRLELRRHKDITSRRLPSGKRSREIGFVTPSEWDGTAPVGTQSYGTRFGRHSGSIMDDGATYPIPPRRPFWTNPGWVVTDQIILPVAEVFSTYYRRIDMQDSFGGVIKAMVYINGRSAKGNLSGNRQVSRQTATSHWGFRWTIQDPADNKRLLAGPESEARLIVTGEHRLIKQGTVDVLITGGGGTSANVPTTLWQVNPAAHKNTILTARIATNEF